MSMAWGAARKLRRSIDNLRRILAIELVCAGAALDLRAPLEPGPATAAVKRALREAVPFFEADREFGPDIAAAVELVRSGRLVSAAEEATGPLD